MNSLIKRSPLFYVGDKYKLMPQLISLFPDKIENFYEPFVGGGTVFLNVNANNYWLNDVDKNLVNIHNYLLRQTSRKDAFFLEIEKIIDKYKLSKSYTKDIIPDELKKLWKKTYFAKFNKAGYEKLRIDYNQNKIHDPLILYILLIYGFNRMLRFNSNGLFNIPVGNVDFNKNVVKALYEYFDIVRNKKINFFTLDFRKFLKNRNFSYNDFVYIDPPYIITFSEYNKYWTEENERDLLEHVDALNKRGVKFALSNVIRYKNKKNEILMRWMGRYNCVNIQSNYISYHNNSTKLIEEVLITNYAK